MTQWTTWFATALATYTIRYVLLALILCILITAPILDGISVAGAAFFGWGSDHFSFRGDGDLPEGRGSFSPLNCLKPGERWQARLKKEDDHIRSNCLPFLPISPGRLTVLNITTFLLKYRIVDRRSICPQVPRLCLGTHVVRALPGHWSAWFTCGSSRNLR